jgi:hypothetical protein
VRAPRAAGISVLPGLRTAGHRQRCTVLAVDGAVASGPRPAGVHVAAGVTRRRPAAATRVRSLGLLVCAAASAAPAAPPAAAADVTGQRTLAVTGQRTLAVTCGPGGAARSADRVGVPAATERCATAAGRPGLYAGGWPRPCAGGWPGAGAA